MSNLMICSNSANALKLNEAEEQNNKRYILQGCFAELGKLNRNGRIYTKEEYLKHLSYLREDIKKGEPLLGELDHPDDRFEVKMKEASHRILDLWYDEQSNTVQGKIELLNTPNGKIAQSIVDQGIPLHISSRAAGTVNSDSTVSIQQIYTYDLVCKPGFAGAVLHRVNESEGTPKYSQDAVNFLNNSYKSESMNAAAQYGFLNEDMSVSEIKATAKLRNEAQDIQINKQIEINIEDMSKPLNETTNADSTIGKPLDISGNGAAALGIPTALEDDNKDEDKDKKEDVSDKPAEADTKPADSSTDSEDTSKKKDESDDKNSDDKKDDNKSEEDKSDDDKKEVQKLNDSEDEDSDNKDDDSDSSDDDKKDDDSSSDDSNSSDDSDSDIEIIDVEAEFEEGDSDKKDDDMIKDVEAEHDEDKDSSDDSDDNSDEDNKDDSKDESERTVDVDSDDDDTDSKKDTEEAEKKAKEADELSDKESKDIQDRKDSIMDKLDKLMDTIEKKNSDKDKAKNESIIMAQYPISMRLTESNFEEFAKLDESQKNKVVAYLHDNNIADNESINESWKNGIDYTAEVPVWLKYAPDNYKALYESAPQSVKDSLTYTANCVLFENQSDINTFWENSGLAEANERKLINESFIKNMPKVTPAEKELDLPYSNEYIKMITEMASEYNKNY